MLSTGRRREWRLQIADDQFITKRLRRQEQWKD
jgi:hypothetical protein